MKEGWRESSLADVSQFINRGISPKYIESGGIAVVNQKCIRGHEVSIALCRRHDIAVKSVSPDRLVQIGDVLVNSTGTGTLGRVAQVRNELPEATTVDSHVTIVRPSEETFFPPFFGYAMIAIESEIQNGGEGCGGQTELARSKLANDYRIRFPIDHAEQKRIVATLDQALGAIDTAKCNSKRNVLNAKGLFTSCLNEVFAKQRVNRSHVRIDSVCESIVDCVNKTAPKVKGPTPYKMIRTTNVRNGDVSLDSVNYVTRETYKTWTRRQVPRRGDVLLTREAPLGEAGMLLSDDNVFLGQRLVAYRADDAKLDNQYLLFALQSADVQNQIASMASGATVQHMRVPDCSKLVLPLPHLSEQRAAVQHLVQAKEASERVASIYTRKLLDLDQLKGALLNDVFRGHA